MPVVFLPNVFFMVSSTGFFGYYDDALLLSLVPKRLPADVGSACIA